MKLLTDLGKMHTHKKSMSDSMRFFLHKNTRIDCYFQKGLVFLHQIFKRENRSSASIYGMCRFHEVAMLDRWRGTGSCYEGHYSKPSNY